jgi:5-methylcytosine-specific restriction endonuclease McrA
MVGNLEWSPAPTQMGEYEMVDSDSTIVKDTTHSVTCPCGMVVRVSPSQAGRKKYCSKKCFYKFRKRPKGLSYSLKVDNPSWFLDGHSPWNTGRSRKQETKGKISKTLNGRHISPDTQLTAERVRGSKNVNWKGGVTPLMAQIRHHQKNKEWRVSVFEVHGYVCQECGQKGGNLNAHHVVTFESLIKEHSIRTLEAALDCDKLWDVENGMTLCEKCHNTIHAGVKI